MADTYFESSWGGLRLWISQITTDRGRTQVIHEPSQGDEYVVQDRGRNLRTANVDLLFDEMDADDLTPRERLDAFIALESGKDPQLFTHPVEGTYLAAIENFSYTVDEDSVIRGRCTLLETGSDTESVADVGGGAASPAGENAVNAAADEADAALADVGLSTSATGDSRAMVTGWSDNESEPRTVFAESQAMARRIGDEIVSLQLEVDLKLWPAYAAMVSLLEAVRAAADAATATVALLYTVRVVEPLPLRLLLARVYGAGEVDLRFGQAMGMNDISNPALLDAGISLKLPQPAPQSRRG